jgi:isoleucyl-tRNA synthetase
MDDWLRNMGDWNISRRRYFGLPLPFYECECGHFNVIGSRGELETRAVRGLEQLQELHRPWIDEVVIRCEECGGEVSASLRLVTRGSTPESFTSRRSAGRTRCGA